MKTTEIVSGLLKFSNYFEWGEEDDGGKPCCAECYNSPPEHTPDCKFIELTEAAAEYLKLMEGAKK